MMSDMKIFTVRQLDRSPAVVLDAAEVDGAVLVRRRDGRSYRISAERAAARTTRAPDFASWRKSIGMPRLPRAQVQAVDRLIAGE